MECNDFPLCLTREQIIFGPKILRRLDRPGFRTALFGRRIAFQVGIQNAEMDIAIVKAVVAFVARLMELVDKGLLGFRRRLAGILMISHDGIEDNVPQQIAGWIEKLLCPGLRARAALANDIAGMDGQRGSTLAD